MAVAVGRLEAPGPKPRDVWFTFGMSVLLHGLLVAGIVLIPHFRVGTYITVPVSYTVSLVSAPPGGRASGRSAQSAPPATAPAPAQRAPAARPAPAPRPTEELTLPGRQVVRKPTKSLEPSLRPPPVTAPETARPATPSLAPPAPAAPVAAPPAPPVASVGTGTGRGEGKSSGPELIGKGEGSGGGGPLSYYLTLVDRKIDENWVRVPVAGAAEIMVIVRFRVLRSGQVRDVELDSSSGNASVDTSALRAVRQSMPLPPFPNLLTEPYLDLRYRFVMERG